MAWYAETLEDDDMYAVPVVGPILRRHKRKRGIGGKGAGVACEGPSSFVVAGSWLTLEKLTGSKLVLAPPSTPVQYAEEEEAWRVTTEGLAKRLEEQNLKLVDVNGKLRVIGWYHPFPPGNCCSLVSASLCVVLRLFSLVCLLVLIQFLLRLCLLLCSLDLSLWSCDSKRKSLDVNC